MTKNPLNLIRLLDLDADSDRIHGRFDKNTLVLVSRDDQGIEQHFLRTSGKTVNGDHGHFEGAALTQLLPQACCAVRLPMIKVIMDPLSQHTTERLHLGREVLQRQSCRQCRSDGSKIRS